MQLSPINFSDSGFNPDYTADFQLIIILSAGGFSYAVCHPVTRRLIRVSTNCPMAALFDPQNQKTFAASHYQKVTIAADTNSFCLIPNTVFTTENLGDFAAFLSVKEADLILTDQLSNGENTVIFTLQEALVKQIEAQYPSAKIQFAPKSWIKTVFDTRPENQNLYLFLAENTLKILYPDQENVRFYNQFDCTTADETVYFTALVADQLKLKPAETSLIICSEAEDGSEAMLLLQTFFKQVLLFSASDLKQHNQLKQHQIIQFLGFN